jgi:hypothetical protein
MRTAGGRIAVAVVAVAVAAVAVVASPRDARGECRTTTCALPPSFSPVTTCTPPNFVAYCQALTPPEQVLYVWWRNACVSYDIQKDASSQVTLVQAEGIAKAAFDQWTQAACTVDASGATAPVSIQVTYRGPVDCDMVQYNSDQGNQHVIIFHDTNWPYPNDQVNTLGLTTVTFDATTGEIYDADTEINATKPLTVSGPVPADGYDLASIITHEMGHFLGLAHSMVPTATMYATYRQGSTSMATLSPDDIAGICSINPPGGIRNVDPSVSASGTIPADACDDTPRHGFQSVCAQPISHGCSLAGLPARERDVGGLATGFVLLGVAGARRRAATARVGRGARSGDRGA